MAWPFKRKPEGEASNSGPVTAAANKMMAMAEPTMYPVDPSAAVSAFSLLTLKFSGALADMQLKAWEDAGIAARLDSTAVLPTYLEGCYLFLHLLDRQAIADLGPERRDTLFNYALSKILERVARIADGLPDMLPDMTEAQKKDMKRMLDQARLVCLARTDEYATIRNVMPLNTAFTDSLFGRYLSKLQQLANSELDPASSIPMVLSAGAYLKALNIPGLVRVWAESHPTGKSASAA